MTHRQPLPIHYLWQRGLNTLQISKNTGYSEAEVYNALGKILDARYHKEKKLIGYTGFDATELDIHAK